MDTEIDQKCNCKEFLQELQKDCFDKLVGSEIFVLSENVNPKVNYEKIFSQMNIDEISSTLESFDDICNYNKDFAQLRLKFFYPNINFLIFFALIKRPYFFYIKSYINNSRDLINIFIRLPKKCLCKNSI